MTTASKAKGSKAELDFVKYLKGERGYVEADRRLAGATNDKGDVSGVPGVTFEVKNHKQFRFTEWLREAAVEKVNAGTRVGVVIAKRYGKGWPGNWLAVMEVDDFMDLLEEAGYGPEAPWLRKKGGNSDV